MKKRSVLLWITKQVRRRIPALAVMTGAQVGYSLFLALFALSSSSVIDGATSGDAQLFRAACIRQFWLIIGGILCLVVLRHLRDILHAELDRDWKKKLLNGLLHGEFAQVRKYHSAELINRMNNDVTRVNDGVLNVLPSAAAMVTRLAAALTFLGMLDFRFMAIMAATGVLMVAATAFMRRRLKDLNKKVSEHDGRVSAFLQEVLEKLLVVQAMDVSQEVETRAGVLMDDRFRIQRTRKNVSLFINTGLSASYYGVSFFALVWCGARLMAGAMTFGGLMAVIQLVNQLQTPFVNLSGILPQYTAMLASAERLMEIEDIPNADAAPLRPAAQLYDGMRELRSDGLSFSYDRDPILTNASFSLPKGAFAAITGPSGIGKSTILKLLLGIYQPDSGALLIHGDGGSVPVSRATRRLFAYVPQGNLLLSGTLRENLTIVNPSAMQAEVDAALHASTMDEFVSALPQGLDTVLGENGLGLSEGQAQRLAIARAIISQAPILLLDECTSALDEATEEKVLSRIRALPGKTLLAVTHRPTAMRLCDYLLQVDGGQITAVRVTE